MSRLSLPLLVMTVAMAACDTESSQPEPEAAAAPGVGGKADGACEAPGEEFTPVRVEDIAANPEAFLGKKVAVFGSASVGGASCTELFCPDNACCNSCSGDMTLRTDLAEISLSGLSCSGNECDFFHNCDLDVGAVATVWGTVSEGFFGLAIETEGSCPGQVIDVPVTNPPQIEPETAILRAGAWLGEQEQSQFIQWNEADVQVSLTPHGEDVSYDVHVFDGGDCGIRIAVDHGSGEVLHPEQTDWNCL